MGTKVYVRERGEGREREGKRERREREERRDGGGGREGEKERTTYGLPSSLTRLTVTNTIKVMAQMSQTFIP